MDAIKICLRPIYSELKGYYVEAPKSEDRIYDQLAIDLADNLNSAIEELNQVTGKNYDKYKITCRITPWNRSTRRYIEATDYRSRLSGLISKVQGEFFSEEQSISSAPQTVINAHQSQFQYQQQTMIVDIAMFIAEKKSEYTKDTPERTFLDKLGESIKSAKNIQDIIQNIISIAAATGLGIDALSKIFA